MNVVGVAQDKEGAVETAPRTLEIVRRDPASPYDARPFTRKAPLDLAAIRNLSRWIDLGAAFIVAIVSIEMVAAGLLEASVRLALPYMAFPVLAIWGVWMAEGYRFAFTERALHHLGRTALGASLSLGVGLLACAVFGIGGDPITLSALAGLIWVTLLALHAHYVAWIKGLTRSGRLSENVVIVGATPNARKLIEQNQRDRELNVVGIFDDRLGRAPKMIADVPVLGKLDDLLDWELLPDVDRIIVTVSSKAQDRVRMMIDRLRYLPNRVVLLLDLDDYNANGASLAQVADAPAAYVSGAPRNARRAAVKRVSDLVFGACMLVGFAPVMAIIAGLIKLHDGGPVFFKQKRHGFNNQEIRVWKFRTMRPDRKAEDGVIRQVTGDDDRITPIGRFLRRTSLDELPQLVNVLKGEMSLVGPRPHAIHMTTEEVEVHTLVADYAHRHRVKPGLTGWAQINGSRGPVHTAELVRERVRLDMEYVNRSSFWFDLYIMVMTAPCLLGDDETDR